MTIKNKTAKWFKHPLISCLLLSIFAMAIILTITRNGFLQNLELRAFDYFLLQQRDGVEIDNRIVIIGETEPDIRRYHHPLSDQILTDALQLLENVGVRVIGVDKYRDVPVATGTENLKKILQQYTNIVWISFVGDAEKNTIPAPQVLENNPERIGFNDMTEDVDGVQRRGLLYLDNTQSPSFPLLLTLHYLAKEKISPDSDEKGNLRFNGVSFIPLDDHFGAYQNFDANGYQIMLDYPALPKKFTFFTLSDLFDGKISAEKLRDKIVLIGGTAPSLSDYKLLPNQTKCFGVESHAYFISQLLNSALTQTKPFSALSDNEEFLILFGWCLIGAFSGLRRRGFLQLFVVISLEFLLLTGSHIFFFKHHLWLPFVSPLLGWFSSIALSLLYFFEQERAERHQLMQLFSSHVSPEIATRLWNEREQFFSEGGVRPDTLVATILFTDISNFTTVCEKMPPLHLMKWLNHYMEEMSQIVINNGGIINKYIGDSIMAMFGAPVKRLNDTEIALDAQNAVKCALQLNQRLQELNLEWRAKNLPIITMRVGIYTGSLVAGSFGGSIRAEYTVIGDTVNIASRLESFDKTIATPDELKPCRILIGETTYNYVHHLYKTQLVGECQLKGKNKFSKIYQIFAS